MIIVYLSIALAVVAFVYLGVSGLRTFLATKPAMKSLSDTVADLQSKMEGITDETDQLSRRAENMMQDMQVKKQMVQDVILNAKWGAEEVKSLRRFAVMVPNWKKGSAMDSFGILKPDKTVDDIDQATHDAKSRIAKRKHEEGRL